MLVDRKILRLSGSFVQCCRNTYRAGLSSALIPPPHLLGLRATVDRDQEWHRTGRAGLGGIFVVW